MKTRWSHSFRTTIRKRLWWSSKWATSTWWRFERMKTTLLKNSRKKSTTLQINRICDLYMVCIYIFSSSNNTPSGAKKFPHAGGDSSKDNYHATIFAKSDMTANKNIRDKIETLDAEEFNTLARNLEKSDLYFGGAQRIPEWLHPHMLVNILRWGVIEHVW